MITYTEEKFKEKFESCFENKDYIVKKYDEGKVLLQTFDSIAEIDLSNNNFFIPSDVMKVHEKLLSLSQYDDEPFTLESYYRIDLLTPEYFHTNSFINLLKENVSGIDVCQRIACVEILPEIQKYDSSQVFTLTNHSLNDIEVILIINKRYYDEYPEHFYKYSYPFLHLKKNNEYIQVPLSDHLVRMINSTTHAGIIEETLSPYLEVDISSLHSQSNGAKLISVNLLLKTIFENYIDGITKCQCVSLGSSY